MKELHKGDIPRYFVTNGKYGKGNEEPYKYNTVFNTKNIDFHVKANEKKLDIYIFMCTYLQIQSRVSHTRFK